MNEEHLALAMRLRTSSERLNIASDELNKIIQVLENKLQELNLGVEAQVMTTDKKVAIGYFRATILNKRSWHICAAYLNDEFLPLMSCARDLRIAAIDLIPNLLDELKRVADEVTKNIESKMPMLNEAIVKIKEIQNERSIKS